MNRIKQVQHLLALRKVAERAAAAELQSAAATTGAVRDAMAELHRSVAITLVQQHALIANGDALGQHASSLALEVLDWHSQLQQNSLQAAALFEEEKRQKFYSHRIASEQTEIWLKRVRQREQLREQKREQLLLDEHYLHQRRVSVS